MDEAEEMLRRMVAAGLMTSLPTMRLCVAAAATLVAGRPGSKIKRPEPMFQAGFEIGELEIKFLMATAVSQQRDVVHVACHQDGHGGPTGRISVVHFEDGKPVAHRRCGLVCEPGDTRVILAGVSDEEDERCHFVFEPGRKMVKRPEWIVSDIGDGMNRAGEIWLRLMRSGVLGDCDDELLGLYTLVESPSRPPRK